MIALNEIVKKVLQFSLTFSLEAQSKQLSLAKAENNIL